MILPIFPEGGLTSSVITTVWVGVFVLAFFNLRFGWVLSGLVVPGYLVPLLILRPMAAGVIVVEAIITYLIVYWFSERFARGRFNALFGRDRFMGLVLASIAVRVTLDGWLLPILADWLAARLDRQVDWHSNLQSFGLVVISLLANQFWKPGLVRGILSAAVITGLTWFFVRYGLMEFTNFRLSGVTYVYEGLASSILASPKAYIILVLTAFIASQMNVRYGWDFSGILIPALIALQWYQPAKILSSFVEAAVIFFLAQLVMKLPVFASMTIEGARKLVLFFNVSFAYKMVLGHVLAWLALDIKTTDFYGFGYLLSTLLAIKAYDKDIFPRVMRSTLEVSVAGAVAGNLIGFLFTFLLPSQGVNAATPAVGLAPGRASERGLLVAAAAGDAYLRRAGLAPQPLEPFETRELTAAIELLDAGARGDFVAEGLARTRFRLTRLADGSLAIARREGLGRDLLLFRPQAGRRLMLIAPRVADQPGLAAAVLNLFDSQGARWLLLTAPQPGESADDEGMLGALRRAVRSPELVVMAASGAKPELVLGGASAPALDLPDLRTALPGLASSFDQIADQDLAAGRNAAILRLDPGSVERLAAAGTALPAVPPACSLETSRGGGQPQADLAQLAFVRFAIAEPIARALHAGELQPGSARRAAAMAGLVLDRCLFGNRLQWRLSSGDGRQGSYFVTPRGELARMIETAGDDAPALAVARSLHAGWNAGALLVAPDQGGLVGSQRSLFGVFSQALVRAGKQAPGKVIQVRPAPGGAPTIPSSPELVAVPDLLEPDGEWSKGLPGLGQLAGYRTIILDRGTATAGLELAPNYSIRYLSQTIGQRYATFWVMPPTVGARAGG